MFPVNYVATICVYVLDMLNDIRQTVRSWYVGSDGICICPLVVVDMDVTCM